MGIEGVFLMFFILACANCWAKLSGGEEEALEDFLPSADSGDLVKLFFLLPLVNSYRQTE